MAVSTIPDPYTNGNPLLKPIGTAVTAPEKFPLRKVISAHVDVIDTLCRQNGTDVETLLSQLWLMSRKQPDLLKATPETLIPALSVGIQSGGRFGIDCYVLTFANRKAGTIEAAPCLNYKFIVSLLLQAGGAASIDVQIIYKGDVFSEQYGSEPRVIHNPPPFGTPRGEVIGVCATAYFRGTTPPRWKAMTLAQVEEVRAKSQQWKPEKAGKVCPLWYMEKTALRRLTSLLPQNPKLARVMEVINADDRLDDAEEIEGVIETLPDRPAHVDADGVDLGPASEWETVEEPEKVTVRLDVAMEKPFGKQKIPMGQLSNDGLHEAIEWAVKAEKKTGDAEGRLAHVIACAETILTARARGEIEEPQKEAA